MGAVVGLRGETGFSHGEANVELVEALEELLAQARTGRILALGYASVDVDRTIATSWPGCCDEFDMIAGLSILQHRFMTAREQGA